MNLSLVYLPRLLFTAATLSEPNSSQQIITANARASSMGGFDCQISQYSSATTSGDSPFSSIVITSDSSSPEYGLLDELNKISRYESEWQKYLNEIKIFDEQVNDEQIVMARNIWRSITALFGLAAPLAITQPTVEAALQMAWNKPEEYLDIEVLSDCRISWFYRNRLSGFVDGSGEMSIELRQIPPRFFRYFKKFLRGA